MLTTQIQPKPASRCDERLAEGLRAFERGDPAAALLSFRKAAANDLRRAEPWYWMGRVQEDGGDRIAAGYCYSLAMELGVGYGPARQAMQRLGFLECER